MIIQNIINAIAETPVGQSVTCADLAEKLGNKWPTNILKIVNKSIVPHAPGIIEVRKEGKKFVIHVLGDVKSIEIKKSEKPARVKKEKVAKIPKAPKREKKSAAASEPSEDHAADDAEPAEPVAVKTIDEQFDEFLAGVK